MGRRARIGLALLLVAAVLVAWEPSRVTFQAAAMLPSMLDAGPKPLEWFGEEPRRESLPYRAASPGAEPDLAELWLPAGASVERPAGAMLLVFGVNNLGRTHPAVVRVADALARTGVAVVVPDSRGLLAGRLELDEIDGVVRAFQLLASRPEVDRDRLGIVGFSVGGSLALLAAGDPRIAGMVRWVNAFGAYADAGSYLASVSAHAFLEADGTAVAWMPTPLARQVYLRLVLDQLGDGRDRERLEGRFGPEILAGARPGPDGRLRADLDSEVARTVHDLLTARTLADAQRAIDALPSSAQRFIDAISPVRHLDGLRADVHLMHEVEDRHVPFVESRRLARACDAAGLLATHSEFRLFDHVQPDEMDLAAAAPELLRLLFHVRTLMEETL